MNDDRAGCTLARCAQVFVIPASVPQAGLAGEQLRVPVRIVVHDDGDFAGHIEVTIIVPIVLRCLNAVTDENQLCIVKAGLDRLKKSKPAAFMSQAAAQLVEIGNLEDDFDRLGEVDWIVEVVIEKLDVKRALLERLEAVRRPGSILTTNTSGLPISAITEGRSDDLKRSFFGTHFFNPPRYMRLLEVVAGAATRDDALKVISDFADRRLGKGVVDCHDRPGFIANRIGIFVSLPIASLDKLSLQKRLQELGSREPETA